MPAFLDHFELSVSEIDRAGTFFERVFGWRAGAVSDSLVGRYRRLSAGEAAPGRVRVGLLEGAEVLGSGTTALPVVRLEGEALESCLERVVEAGGSIVSAPRAVEASDGGSGRFARLADPDGHLWGLWEPGG